MLGWDSISTPLALLTLLLCPAAVDGRGGSGSRDKTPGSSPAGDVPGPDGYGCQVKDHEVMLPRDPAKSGADDGSLWIGETVVDWKVYERGNEANRSCNGTERLPTVLWTGPYYQEEEGDNTFALGMLAWSTNSSAKDEPWHAYRPCPLHGSESEKRLSIEIRSGVHYSTDESDTAPDDSTFGLVTTTPSASNDSSPTSSQGVLFNGTYNGMKEDSEYTGGYGDNDITFFDKCHPEGPSGDEYNISYNENIPSGLPVSGSISNDTIKLRMNGTMGQLMLGIGGFTTQRSTVADFNISFTGGFDHHNSTQSVIVDPASEPIVRFSAGSRLQPVGSFLLMMVLGSFYVFC